MAVTTRIAGQGRSVTNLAALTRLHREQVGRLRENLRRIGDALERSAELTREFAALDNTPGAGRRVERALAESVAANRAKDELLAVVSDEVRSSVGAMRLWVAQLHGRRLEARRSRQVAQHIERSLDLMTRLAEDLLDLSAITTDKLRLELQQLDFRTVVRAAVRDLQPLARTKAILLVFRPPRHPTWVTGDPRRLQQVVTNLVSNALKRTPADGRVTVRVSGDVRQVRLEVSDTGRGITAALLSHVFEPYRQGVRDSAGFGLGPAIIRHLVELEGGTVTALSAGEGRGTTFVLTIPRRRYARAALGEASGLHRARRGSNSS